MTASLIKPCVEVRPLRSVPGLAQTEGLLQVHTAPFRGSFDGVFSQALRTAGLGSRVLISQFLKGGVDQGPEHSLWLCGRLQWMRPAVPACLTEPADGEAERAAVEQVWAFSRRQLLTGELSLLVLDELGLAIGLGYLEAAEVEASLRQRPPNLDVILTGPSIPEGLLAMADQVTQLRRNC
ncbi:cob(I)yrinic acid a,c-diamide adenosyltransferase [Synechococcus sp. CS-1324]|uniref:cob(I)yrinic acid a,c-diamide adenosyltransferase n=1 Tax=Synechococcus sp. CS-1324 TaxID=2847980 RepID=UPI00223BBF89|nr:cob(I)yrinic acid a,c-diamide adenosyltransferase [Synechococcus sp. CS-1324]MCT0230227.1 cob(I)yrinic acid a,c-diamide adenosyltransferase [Synechococcus sp. CS-1324]